MVQLRLKNVTLFAQDWGGLVGLRVVARLPDRFSRVCISNTGLPTGNQKPSKAFVTWASKVSQELPKWSSLLRATCRRRNLSEAELYAYDAPFPSEAYKAATRIGPKLVPVTNMHLSVEENKGAIRRVFSNWEKPFLTLFGDKDPITKGGEKFWQQLVPGAKGQRHRLIKVRNALTFSMHRLINFFITEQGGHFIQEDAPDELVKCIVAFIRKNPLGFRSAL